MTIDRPNEDYVGLFSFVGSGSTLENIVLKNIDITGNDFVGGLVGLNGGTATDSYGIPKRAGKEARSAAVRGC